MNKHRLIKCRLPYSLQFQINSLRLTLFRNTLCAFNPTERIYDHVVSAPVINMTIKFAAACFLFLIALSCSNSKLNSGRDAELQPRNEPLKVGEMAPNFTLEDQNGQKVNLSALRGSGPTVLAFYRGNW